MDVTRFDGVARGISALLTRRSSLGFLASASLPVLGLAASTDAKKRKKITLCVNGQTIQKPKKKAKKLQKQGATKGACPAGCPAGQKTCGDVCVPSAQCCPDQKACGNTCIPVSDCCIDDDCTGDDLCENGTCVPLRCGNGGPCVVFVTSQTFLGTDFGGLDAADAKCTSLANDAYPDFTFRAWLSDATQSPATRFDHIERAGPWVLPPNDALDGDDPPPTVAADFNDLTTCDGGQCLQHAINRDQDGALVAMTGVWTGTQEDGTADPVNCAGWTNEGHPDELGRYGLCSSTDAQWTNSSLYDCDAGDFRPRLYCFQQAT